MTLTEKYEIGNRKAAKIILSDPEKYAGLPVEWAKLWLARHPLRVNPKQADTLNRFPLWEEEELPA